MQKERIKILITGAFTNDEKIFDLIKKQGFDIVFLQNEKDALDFDPADIKGVICNGLFLHHPIEKFTSLKFIQLTSAGFDRVSMDYVKEKGIKIFNARGVYSVPMAEFAVSGVLALYKRLDFFFQNQKEHRWEKHRNILELFEKNVLIVGAGNVGQECAKRFKAMGCKVFGADICPTKSEWFEEISPMTKLDNLLAKSEIVILTLPLTKETKHLFNQSKFDVMKNGAIFLNISRGAVVDTNDLIVALNQKLGGAVLDVFEDEPLSDNSPLWDMENVLITPHNSFVGEGNKERLLKVILENLRECYEI